jgi:centrosomal protein CEP104
MNKIHGKKKKKDSKQKEENIVDLSNPYAFNEGDVDLELYFRPLIINVGEKVPDIPPEVFRRLHSLGYLTIFGAKIWAAVHSENWRHREAAAQAVLNFIEMPLPSKYLDGKSKKLFLACMEMAKIACEDKILQIYFIGKYI